MLDPQSLHRLAERAAGGLPTLVCGPLPQTLPLRPGTLLIRARCDSDPRPLGVLRDAAERAAAWMGERFRLDPGPPSRRPRRWGFDTPDLTRGPVRIAETLHRLARQAPRGAVLVLEGVEAADPATATLLERIADAPGVLGLTVVLVFSAEPPTELHRHLLARWRSRLGPDGVLGDFPRRPNAREPLPVPEALPGPEAPREPEALPQPASLQEPAEPEAPQPLDMLSAEARMTLRAAAVTGPRFDADTVAALRGIDPLRVLEHLQSAVDRALPLTDLGDGRFLLGSSLATALQAELTPSLARAWHRILGARLGPPPADAGRAPPGPPPPEAPAAPEAPRAVETPASPRVSKPPRAERVQIPLPSGPPGSGPDALLAAEHLAAAGDPDGAARALLESARELTLLGLAAEALGQIRRALETVESLPTTPARRILGIEALLARGMLQWRGSGPASDFTLAAAWETLGGARDRLQPGDPAGLRGAVASARAGVAVDLGDLGALEEALDTLSEAVRTLLHEGEAVEAARLLNDQAAVYLRLGDTVRAADLLERARKVFGDRIDALPWDQIDPALFDELAAAEHLTARLPLVVPARAGRESEALGFGRTHAMTALERYGRLGDAREAARVRETLARLELRAGRPAKAEEHLLAALATQEQLGDVLGLARSSAVLAEVCASTGRIEEALRRVSDSVSFNVDKGSALGLAYDLRTLERVRASLGPEAAAHASRMAQIEAQIRDARQLVGEARLPDGGP